MIDNRGRIVYYVGLSSELAPLTTHLYPGSARIGIAWYEVDPGYYLLKALSWLGLVWDLRRPSGHTS